MPDRAAAEAFIDLYRRTFEAFDVEAIGALFAYPVQVTSDGDGVTVVSIPAAEQWLPQLERLVGAYRLLGIAAAMALSIHVVRVTPRVLHAVVQWALATAEGTPVYEFTASYTLVTTGEGLRISAVAHDESSKLAAAAARSRGARPLDEPRQTGVVE